MVDIGPVVKKKRTKMEKFTTTTTMDKLWSEKLTWAVGSGELKFNILLTEKKKPQNQNID